MVFAQYRKPGEAYSIKWLKNMDIAPKNKLIRPHLNNLLVRFIDLLEFLLGMAQRFG